MCTHLTLRNCRKEFICVCRGRLILHAIYNSTVQMYTYTVLRSSLFKSFMFNFMSPYVQYIYTVHVQYMSFFVIYIPLNWIQLWLQFWLQWNRFLCSYGNTVGHTCTRVEFFYFSCLLGCPFPVQWTLKHRIHHNALYQ